VHEAAHAVYVLDGPLCAGLPGVSALVVPPGRASDPAMPARCVYGMQLDASTQMCPDGYFLVSLSSRMDAGCDPAEARTQMRCALDALVKAQAPPNTEEVGQTLSSDDDGDDGCLGQGTDKTPAVLWSCFSILPLEGGALDPPAEGTLPKGVASLGRAPTVGIGASVEDAVERARACVALICSPDTPFFPHPDPPDGT